MQSQRSSSVALQAQGSTDHSATDTHQPRTNGAGPAADDAAEQREGIPQPATDSSEAGQQSTGDAEGQQNRESQDGGVDPSSDAQPAGDAGTDEGSGNDGRTAHLASLAEQADIRQAMQCTQSA